MAQRKKYLHLDGSRPLTVAPMSEIRILYPVTSAAAAIVRFSVCRPFVWQTGAICSHTRERKIFHVFLFAQIADIFGIFHRIVFFFFAAGSNVQFSSQSRFAATKNCAYIQIDSYQSAYTNRILSKSRWYSFFFLLSIHSFILKDYGQTINFNQNIFVLHFCISRAQTTMLYWFDSKKKKWLVHISHDLVNATKPVYVADDNSENSAWQKFSSISYSICHGPDVLDEFWPPRINYNVLCISIALVLSVALHLPAEWQLNKIIQRKKKIRVVLRGIRIAVQWSCKFRRRRQISSRRRRRKYVQLTPRNASCKATQRKHTAQIPKTKEEEKRRKKTLKRWHHIQCNNLFVELKVMPVVMCRIAESAHWKMFSRRTEHWSIAKNIFSSNDLLLAFWFYSLPPSGVAATSSSVRSLWNMLLWVFGGMKWESIWVVSNRFFPM